MAKKDANRAGCLPEGLVQKCSANFIHVFAKYLSVVGWPDLFPFSVEDGAPFLTLSWDKRPRDLGLQRRREALVIGGLLTYVLVPTPLGSSIVLPTSLSHSLRILHTSCSCSLWPLPYLGFLSCKKFGDMETFSHPKFREKVKISNFHE